MLVGVMTRQGLMLRAVVVVAHVVVDIEIPEARGRMVRIVMVPERGRVDQPMRVCPWQQGHHEQVQAKQEGKEALHQGKGADKSKTG